ncbi:MAG: histone deacetylase [Thermoguttaceae bacterium]|jgi:acetoin utilization deacetylase AcuC-like enzyme|nr:histone deacetylase [Thermoguttaceae bacterium]
MTLLYTDPRFFEHETGHHPERADRIRMIEPQLRAEGLWDRCTHVNPVSILPEQLARVHSPDYITEIWGACKAGGGYIEADTVLSPASYDVALLAAGSCSDAVRRVLQEKDRTALCIVRPPGHHALMNRAMGFCLFNNIAVAAMVATTEYELERVLIVDFDVHHGNGTQATFWDDPKVGFFSIHRYPYYPGTGGAEETGSGRGIGTTTNLPVRYGTPRHDYLTLFADRLEQFAARIRPQLVLVSAGFDSHRADPVGDLGLEMEDFESIARTIVGIAATHAGGKVVTVLEGGYNPQVTAEAIALYVRCLLDGSGP